MASAYIRRKQWEAGVMSVAVWGGLGDTFGGDKKPRGITPPRRKPVQWVGQHEMMKMMGFDPSRAN